MNPIKRLIGNLSIFGARFSGIGGPIQQEGEQSPLPSYTGESKASSVTFDSAMTVSAVWACNRIMAETIAAMPLHCYKIKGGRPEENTEYQLWRLLNYQPNRYQTYTEFWETTCLNLFSWGNAYIGIERVGDTIVSLLPLMAAQMEVMLLEDGEIVYKYTDSDGNVKIYARESIWHIKLFGNGIVGLSPLGYARQTVSTAVATNNRVSKLAENGGKQSGILTIDRVLDETQRKAIRRNFDSLTQGPDDTLFVLEAGMEYQPTSISPSDMQLIEQRRFNIEDICRFWGVPSVLVNDTQGSTVWGSGIQQIIEGFYKFTIRPNLERIESSMRRHLQPQKDWSKYVLQFDVDSLLRMDAKSRVETLGAAINNGQMTPNEARASEGRGPKEGGDTLYLNSTLIPANIAGSNNGGQADGAQTTPTEPEPDQVQK